MSSVLQYSNNSLLHPLRENNVFPTFYFYLYCDPVFFLVNIYVSANKTEPHPWQTDFLLKEERNEKKEQNSQEDIHASPP